MRFHVDIESISREDRLENDWKPNADKLVVESVYLRVLLLVRLQKIYKKYSSMVFTTDTLR